MLSGHVANMERTAFDTDACMSAIAEHSGGLAAAAEGNLDAAVESCPGWHVGDLVSHVTGVHWFWATIADERLSAPPSQDRRPPRAAPAELVETFRAGADRLCAVLSAADQAATVWTWAPAHQDIAFITRHQVQEAAVHHWGAVHAAGGALVIGSAAAADAVAEFLTVSVSSDADPADPQRPALDGRFTLIATDAGTAWTVTDGGTPGTVAVHETAVDGDRVDAAGAGFVVRATASNLLLWLYGRVPLETATVPGDLLARFRVLCFTD